MGKKETVPDEPYLRPYRLFGRIAGILCFPPSTIFKNHLTVTLSPKPPELARSRSTAPRHSRFFDARLPALHKTLHSPLFYHTEPAPQQKFAATRPARGCTLIAPKNKINVTLIGLALDPVRVTVTPPPGLRNVEVSTEF